MRLLRALFAPFLSRQFLVFLAVGGTCAIVNFGTGALVRMASTGPIAYGASIVLGFTTGTALSFVLNRRFTFQATDQPARPQAIRFALIALVSIGVAAVVAEILLRAVRFVAGNALTPGQMENLAHLGSIGVITIYSFVAIKFFAMKTPPRTT